MISCIYEKRKTRITLTGHAEYAEYGKDIVCAAATVLMYTLAAQCRDILGEKADGLTADFESGRICVFFRGKNRRVSDAFGQTVLGLKVIEKNFGKFLRVIEKP